MKPDFIDNIESDELTTDEKGFESIRDAKYCMLIVVQSKERNDKYKILNNIPWIKQVVICNNIIAAFFDKSPSLKQIDIFISSLRQETSFIISLADHKDHQLDVFYESRFFWSDYVRNHTCYKSLKLYNALKEKRIIKYIPETKKPSLNIINISSSIDISYDLDIRWYLESLSMNFDSLFSHLNFVTFNYPILLKHPKDMPDYDKLWGIEKKGNEGYFPKDISIMGYYTRSDNDSIEGPQIVLCPEKIEKTANELKTEDIFKCDNKIIYGIVLIHELAHALMDLYIKYSFRIERDKVIGYKTDVNDNWPIGSIATVAMEESLANMITLKWFNHFMPDDLESVKIFISKQPPFYKFGIWQEYAGVNWKKWRESNKKMDALNVWFDQCFSDGKIKIHEEDYSKDIYDKVFL